MFDIKSVPLPNYSRSEDIANSISHLIGVPFCIIAMALLLKLQLESKLSSVDIFGTCLYLLSTMCVFLVSGIYHGLKPGFAKQIARLIDHSDIYIMISGTVTALLICNREILNKKLAYTVIALIWFFSAVGIVLTFMDLKKFNTPQIFMYVALGWSAFFSMKPLWNMGQVGRNFVLSIIAGGLFITAGAVLYFIGKKKKYFHMVFHIFVLLGCICNFIGTYNYHSIILK